ncbi:nucleotidyltransferase domain-containing protein [Anaerospora sp.]|uniref:nucleotidyltransferase domain-containing protein n=1 Tax=Anaerospora sp. TaxID=1960278 RepID=UPI00289B013F|nr:nucleotidyltransferase domain-containing protein [Anaerospora sp.]
MLSNAQFRKLLLSLKPYVFVVGSYATGCNRKDSDLDLYIRPLSDGINIDYANIAKVEKIILEFGLQFEQQLPTDFWITKGVPIVLDINALHGALLTQPPTYGTVIILGIAMDAITNVWDK